MQEVVVQGGEVIIWQGEGGDKFYVLERGQCEVLQGGQVVAHLFPPKSFGEMALLSPPTVRQATIRACQLCRAWGLDRQTVRNLAQAEYEKRMAERVAFLSTIELFANLLPSQLEKISEVMQEAYFSMGSRIIKQGEKGDVFFMVKTGRVSVTQVQGGTGLRGSLVGSIGGGVSASGSASSKDVELVKLGPGKYFGELALIENAPRKASVTAVTNVCCYTLDRQQFLSVFGSLGGAIQEGVGVKMLRRVGVCSYMLCSHCFQPKCSILVELCSSV
ncbi:cyclic nucleotide-binding domain-containing protein [archaeon]|nr:MAG: cyclic nucleotide-binding domain-containing protein [archaeon]